MTNQLLNEADFRLKRTLMNIKVRLSVDPEAHIPDTMTRIRILASVAVVSQTMRSQTLADGREYLELSIKFMPNSDGVYKNLVTIAKMMKSMPGVKSVRVLELSGKPVTFQGQPIVI